MTHEEWSKKVRMALIEEDMTIKTLALALGRSPEWARMAIYGRNIYPETVEAISHYLGVENYLGED